MKRSCQTTNIQHLAFQRNASLGLVFILALALLVVSLLLFTKSQRVIVVPYGINEKIWIEDNKVSKTYLSLHSEHIANLLLSKSSATASKQREYLLILTDPSYHGALKKKLIEEEKVLKKEGISYVFLPSEIVGSEDDLTASVIGDRISYLGDEKIKTSREHYIFGYRFNGKALYLNSIERKKKDND